LSRNVESSGYAGAAGFGLVGGAGRAWLLPPEHAAATTATETASPKAVHRDPRTARSVASTTRERTADTLRLMVTVRVDADLCVGHGRCYALAPDVFGADEFGHCVVLEEQVGAGLESQARMGADNCPEQAITIEP